MRVYFEKPRTTVGWKGLINDPHLDHTYALNDGLRMARKLLSDINDLEVPSAGEFLDMITPQYIADFMSWGQSAQERPNLKCIVNWLPAYPVRSVSKRHQRRRKNCA